MAYQLIPSKAVDSVAGATDSGLMALAVRDDALSALTPVDGDYVQLRTDQYGALWVSLATKLNSTDDSVTAVVTSITPGTTATDLGKAEDAAHASGDTGVMMLGVANESNTARAANNDYLPIATDTEGNVRNTGNRDHDAADAGEPLKVGTKAIAALSGATLVAAADRTDAYGDLDGAILTRANGAIGDYVNGNASNTDGASTEVLAAGAAGIKHYITDVTIVNTSAGNIYVELKDGTTVKWVFPVPANGGVTHNFTTPIGGTAATAWNFDPSAATTTVYCSVAGFKSKI